MNQPLSQQIGVELGRYLRGERTLREFYHWFMPASWDVHRHEDPQAERLVGEIGLKLAEYSAGHVTEDEIREEFEALLEEHQVADRVSKLSRRSGRDVG
jgi:hypothetical protein